MEEESTKAEQTSTMVIGIGNSLRSDDGVGCRIAERLSADIGDRESVTVRTGMQLVPELVSDVAMAGAVIIIDATFDVPAGEWRVRKARPGKERCSTSHILSIETLLRLALDIYDYCPTCELVCVGVGSIDCGEDLTPAVSRAAAEIVTWMKARLDAHPHAPA